MVRERGGGKTPQRVVELLQQEVSEKSILAVAKSTNLGLAAIGRYLKGIGEPTTATLQKLADHFRVTVPWLRGESDWGPNGEGPVAVCARCGGVLELQGDLSALPLKLWPCKQCCKKEHEQIEEEL